MLLRWNVIAGVDPVAVVVVVIVIVAVVVGVVTVW